MPTIGESARIPKELAAFRNALLLGEHATGVEIIDRSLAAVVERAQAQAYVASQPGRPDKRDVRDARTWDNWLRFQRLIEERPLGYKGTGRPWNLLDHPRTQASGGMGAAGRSPQDHVTATRGRKIEW